VSGLIMRANHDSNSI